MFDGLTMDAWAPEMQGADGFALLNQMRQMPNLLKALEAQGTLPFAGPGINALGIEDVSPTMASAEYMAEELILWKLLRKAKATNLIPEFSRLDQYGQGYRPGFVSDTSSGYTDDPVFFRGNAPIRYMMEKFETTLPTALAEFIGPSGIGVNATATNRMSAMARMLRNIERNIVFGDARLDNYNWIGILQWIDSVATKANRCSLDLRGGFLNRFVIAYVNEVFASNHANPTLFAVPNAGYLDLQTSMFPDARGAMNMPNQRIGADFDNMLTILLGGRLGYMKIERMSMLGYGISGGLPNVSFTQAAPDGPNSPTAVSGAAASWIYSDSQPGISAGTYYYEVAAIGEGGNSSGTVSAGIACSDGQAITINITCPNEKVTHYMVFRNKTGETGSSATRYLLTRVPRPSGGVTISWTDSGAYRPDTYHAIGLTMNPLRTYMKQLLSVMERKLPPAAMSDQAVLLYFASLIMEEPTKNVHLKNIGKQPQTPVGTVWVSG